jgi:hypothetical protein
MAGHACPPSFTVTCSTRTVCSAPLRYRLSASTCAANVLASLLKARSALSCWCGSHGALDIENIQIARPSYATGGGADGEVGVAWYSCRKLHLPGAYKLLSRSRIRSNLNRKGSKRESSSSIFFAILSMNPMNRGVNCCVWEQQSMRTSSL